MALSVTQQHLFSFFNIFPVASLKKLYDVFEEIVKSSKNEKPPSLERLYREISLINRIIQNYDLEIVASIDELTSQKLFILVNTTDNSISRKTKFYDRHTSQYFSRIVQDCIMSEKGYLSETYCLNLSSQVGLSKSAAQMTLERFKREKWIVAKEGTISLGMRSVVELEQLIKQRYPKEVKYCPLCKLMIIQGYICTKCKLRCHYACVKKLIALSKSKCVCPECKEVWNDLPHLFQSKRDDIIIKEEPSVFPDPVPPKKKRRSSEIKK